MITVWVLAALGVLLAGFQQFLVYQSDSAHEAKLQASSQQLENIKGQLQSMSTMVGTIAQNPNNPSIQQIGAAMEKIAAGITSPSPQGSLSTEVPNASTTIHVSPKSGGPFQVPHNLPCLPVWVDIQMTSGGNMWFQTPKFDSKNLYLIPSAGDTSADILVSCNR